MLLITLLLSISLLLRSLGVILERSNLGSNQINVGHRAWPRSAPTEAFRVEPVGIKVSIELIFSLAPFEDEENHDYEGEDTDGTPGDATGDGSDIWGRSVIGDLG